MPSRLITSRRPRAANSALGHRRRLGLLRRCWPGGETRRGCLLLLGAWAQVAMQLEDFAQLLEGLPLEPLLLRLSHRVDWEESASGVSCARAGGH